MSSLDITDLNEYCGDQLVGTSIAFLLLNVIFVTLRFVARRITGHSFALDDYLIVGALLANLALDPLCLGMLLAGVSLKVLADSNSSRIRRRNRETCCILDRHNASTRGLDQLGQDPLHRRADLFPGRSVRKTRHSSYVYSHIHIEACSIHLVRCGWHSYCCMAGILDSRSGSM